MTRKNVWANLDVESLRDGMLIPHADAALLQVEEAVRQRAMEYPNRPCNGQVTIKVDVDYDAKDQIFTAGAKIGLTMPGLPVSSVVLIKELDQLGEERLMLQRSVEPGQDPKQRKMFDREGKKAGDVQA
ncbi:MAG TPA: hypothetical protein VMY35_06405 [Phycisphaerae bacterium]|nr:hypothetical protein [Phycisphaerae bacterium]